MLFLVLVEQITTSVVVLLTVSVPIPNTPMPAVSGLSRRSEPADIRGRFGRRFSACSGGLGVSVSRKSCILGFILLTLYIHGNERTTLPELRPGVVVVALLFAHSTLR